MKCKSGKKEPIVVFPKPEADDGAEEQTERNVNEMFEEVSMQFVQLCRQTTREENNHTNWSLTYLLIAQKVLGNQYVHRYCLFFPVHQCS